LIEITVNVTKFGTARNNGATRVAQFRRARGVRNRLGTGPSL